MQETSALAIENHKMRGFVFNSLKGTPLERLHSKPGCKFFCYSNVFLPNKGKRPREFESRFGREEKLNWIVSSPIEQFSQLILERLLELKNNGQPLAFGEARFWVEEAKRIRPKVWNNCTIKSATPNLLSFFRISF
jgi:CRISPR/Cas system endoribonuclease Cas6 (RAMP superfamily)